MFLKLEQVVCLLIPTFCQLHQVFKNQGDEDQNIKFTTKNNGVESARKMNVTRSDFN